MPGTDRPEHPYAHVRRRTRERYGLDMTPFEYRVLVGQVRRADPQRARRIYVRDRRLSYWLVLHRGRWLVALYDRALGGLITTVLPLATEFDDAGVPALDGVPLEREAAHGD